MQIETLQPIILAVAQARSLETVLPMIVQGLSDQPHVALARIWLIAPGDICASCRMRQECHDQTRCLHLAASAGNPKNDREDWSRLEGDFRRFPLNVRKIGRIGAAGEPVLLQKIEIVAPTEASVLILGETGTGKELLARAIHERSLRRERPLIKVNCSAVPRELFESEFFGHVKGAFTGALKDRLGRFQMADGGTLFLDEVGEIPLELQSKLLRVLQEGQFERLGDDRTKQVDVRIIAATNRHLQHEIEAGRFRQDLYYRLSVFPVTVPSLRERIEDIPMLTQHFIARTCARLNCPPVRITAAQVQQLQRYHWPGNIRELQNVIERAVILARGGVLQFDPALPRHETGAGSAPAPPKKLPRGPALFEKKIGKNGSART